MAWIFSPVRYLRGIPVASRRGRDGGNSSLQWYAGHESNSPVAKHACTVIFQKLSPGSKINAWSEFMPSLLTYEIYKRLGTN